jgi:hypothetical protein
MNEETRDLIDALKMKIEALQIRNEALKMRVETLEMQFSGFGAQNRQSFGSSASFASSAASAESEDDSEGDDERTGKKRGRKPKPSNGEAKLMEAPLNSRLQDILKGENFNRATYRSLTGVLLCLFVNGTATVNDIYQWIGGSRVTIVRHTGQLKKMGLLVYVGSRKKGHYELTDNGKALLNEVRQSIEL